MRACLDQLAVGCHRYDRQEKTLAYRAARDAASLAAAPYLRSQDPPDCCPSGARPGAASRRAGRNRPGVRTPLHRPVIRRRARKPHRAALYFLACQRRYAWRLHLDIRAYFLSINHSRLLALFAVRIVDADTLALLRLIIAASEQVYRSRLAAATLGARCPAVGWGLPLGSWFSQWCGNFYLDAVDHMIKRQLKIPGYARYMDDLVLFADDKAQLLAAVDSDCRLVAERASVAVEP